MPQEDARSINGSTQELRYFPDISKGIFYVTILAGLFAIPLLGMKYFESNIFPRSSLSDDITFWADTLILQILYALCVITVIARYYFVKIQLDLISPNPQVMWVKLGILKNSPPKDWKQNRSRLFSLSVGLGFLIVCVSLVLEIILESYLKLSFQEPRPAEVNYLGRPFFEAWVNNILIQYLGWGFDIGGAPSGYALRQTTLFLMFALFFEQLLNTRLATKTDAEKESVNLPNAWWRIFAYSVSLFILAFISYARVYRGLHSIFDIGMAIGLGTFFFWVIAIFPHSLIHRRVEFTINIVGASFAYIPLFFFYSRSSYRWIWVALVVYPLLGILYSIVHRSPAYVRIFERDRHRRWKGP